jgi:hypothetical protein
LGRIVAGRNTRALFISMAQQLEYAIVHCAFSRCVHIQIDIVAHSRVVAGLGVEGPFGPRTGNSSGVLPGSSCGGDGVPGSCTGGGTSGRGRPGGSSRGGSVGCPGVGGGISGGSIGIHDNGTDAAMFPRKPAGNREGTQLSRRVADRLDVVTVRVEHERAE